MSTAAPSDLAVAFRSLPRRLREARRDLPDGIVAPFAAEIDRHLREAAELMGTPVEAELVAAAIERVPAHHWQTGHLERLRAIALELGAQLRALAEVDPDA